MIILKKDFDRYINDLMGLNEKFSECFGHKEKTAGWLSNYTKKKPYTGKGSLISIKFSNSRSGEVLYYCLDDREVIQLCTVLFANIGSHQVSASRVLFDLGCNRLMEDQGINFDVQEDWDINLIIKGNYEAKEKEEYDLSHLSTVQCFTIENLMNDFLKAPSRGLNIAQLITEEYMLLLKFELGAA